jgi:hypothetical protein
MDKACWEENLTDNDYKYRMQNQIEYFQSNIETIMKQRMYQPPPPPAMPSNSEDALAMAARMIQALDDLRQFREQTDFVGRDDLALLQQLITFIETLPLAPGGIVAITQPKQLETVTLYYNRLFLPIQQTIMKHKGFHPGPGGSQPPAPLEEAVPPPLQMPATPAVIPRQPPVTFQPSSGTAVGHPMHAVQAAYTPPPSQPRQQAPAAASSGRSVRGPRMSAAHAQPVAQVPGPAPTPPPTAAPQQTRSAQQTPEEFLRQLFTNVRTDCAVFYSTPHPPHF